ncbi:MAG TPA: TIM barrel protein [Bacteroidales bacterium]|jgi:hydroxypyruvate isomerase|nr:TIM barrel protein [Bacteroidales bacterium]HOX75798.1 TIM barrel protein [Bacteroidales bacterium]HPM88503.1 TIM barrel protein [Bacteroidales bacterium]HQM68649.1 TIM barrel protein [Bacteroidales bacterium]
MKSKESISSRRSFVRNLAAAGLVAFIPKSMKTYTSIPAISPAGELKGNINHSACRWCYSSIPFEEFCIKAKEIGLKAVDLVGPEGWPVLRKYGLDSSMCNGAEISIEKGWNEKQYHATLVKNYSEMIPLVAKSGYRNLICLSGNRNGMDDETGLNNCVDGLKQVLGIAEKHNVMLVMELLNSRVDHKDYICDHTWWGVELVKRAGSDNLRLLYDIYHMQIMEGDVIRTIRENSQYIAHYHTGGVPGRNEIDDTQELYYPAIMKAIVETGFKGYVAQEFVPSRADKLESLRQAVNICDV